MEGLYLVGRFQLLREMKRREWMDGTQPYDCLPAVRMTSPHKFLIFEVAAFGIVGMVALVL